MADTDHEQVSRAVIHYKREGIKEAIYSERLNGEDICDFFARVGKTAQEITGYFDSDIKYVRFSGKPVVQEEKA